jgi:hypothetical protein
MNEERVRRGEPQICCNIFLLRDNMNRFRFHAPQAGQTGKRPVLDKGIY